ncbi:hypothetical protein B9Z19DRAFT_1066390 [Tuber borchii]|uniref:Uncharacterized protein n=1 Tax=Tuber borchii TaxID=42251 RepID=A0A2T6ZMN7_TUBBO|nr:hypothetical protein B9Z19DRAFT_1066390 [Tuber borchii]
MTDFKQYSLSNTRMGTDNEDILDEWALSSVPDLQAASFWDESTSTSSEEEETWDESEDEMEGETPIILAPPASKTKVLEALMIYPVSSGVTALLERRDIYALALSCWSIFYALNIEDPISRRSVISRSLRMCHGPDTWGVPNYISAPCQSKHRKILQEGKDVDVKACVKKNCWNDVCISSSVMGVLSSVLHSSIAGNLHHWRANCGVAGYVATACQEGNRIRRYQNAPAPPRMRDDDNTYYGLPDDCNSDCIAAADIKECEQGQRTVYNYSELQGPLNLRDGLR